MNLYETRLSFEFRMSKKVAELTQVVHMLFKKHHEKECEFEALKQIFDDEIKKISQEAKDKIQELERQQKSNEEHRQSLDLIQRNYNDDIEKQKKKYLQEISEKQNALKTANAENFRLKKLLEDANQNIQSLTASITKEASQRGEQLRIKEEENQNLRNSLNRLESKLKEKDHVHDELTKELEQTKQRASKWYKECSTLQAYAEEQSRVRELLQGKNKQLENEIKSLRRQIARKLSVGTVQPPGAPQSKQESPSSEELERLNRELTRYKLELANRDLNLNRVFNDQTPIILDTRSSRGGLIQPLEGHRSLSVMQRSAGPLREKTFHYVVSQGYDDMFEDRATRNGLPKNHRQKSMLEASLSSNRLQNAMSNAQDEKSLMRPKPPRKQELLRSEKTFF